MATLQHPRRGLTITVPDDTVDTYIEAGWERPGASAALVWPTGDWRNTDIVAFADEQGIDLGSARTKQEMLDAIAAARGPVT